MSTANIPTTESSVSNFYWNMLKNLSSDVKLELISRLSVSLLKKEGKNDSPHWASPFVGAWKDERTTDEIVEDIRGARTMNTDIEL